MDNLLLSENYNKYFSMKKDNNNSNFLNKNFCFYLCSKNSIIYRSTNDYTFPDHSVLQETKDKTFAHDVLNDGNNYAYRIYKNVPAEKIYFYHCDHLMTPLFMTDEEGNIVWQAEYYPFGRLYSQSGDAENNLRFPGQYAEKNLGIYYNWHRYYSAKLGRYYAKDKIVWKFGTYLDEFFNYALNNPINKYDFEGKSVRTRLCTSYQNAKIQIAAQKADAASQTCLPCKDKENFRKKIRSLGTKNEVVFYCVGYQKSPKNNIDLCGYTTKDGNIAITDFAINEVPGCGCLEAIILHEVLHLIGYEEGESRSAERRCFKCSEN